SGGVVTRMLERKITCQIYREVILDRRQQDKQWGPLSQLIEMIPGIGQQLRQANAQISDDDYKQVEAIIRGMTPWERRHPEQITHSRRRRIAAGSGVDRAEVNRLLTQFKEMQKMMSQFGSMAKGGGIPGMPGGKGGRGKKGKRGQRGMKGMPNLPFDF